MRRFVFLITLVLILDNAHSQNIETDYDSSYYKIDFTNPESVVNGFINGVSTTNFDLILYVIDPLIEENQKLKGLELIRIRKALISKDERTIERLSRNPQRRHTYINGVTTFSKNREYAYVPCSLNSLVNGNITSTWSEKFTLIKRNSKRFLMSLDEEYVEK